MKMSSDHPLNKLQWLQNTVTHTLFPQQLPLQVAVVHAQDYQPCFLDDSLQLGEGHHLLS